MSFPVGSFPSQLNPGAYLPTTNVWDINQVEAVFENDKISQEELKELLIRLYQNLNFMALNVNLKDTGLFPLTEFLTGSQYFPNNLVTNLPSTSTQFRNVFRTVVNFGALVNAGSKSVAHNIQIDAASGPAYSFTRIFAAASDTTGFNYIPIPYASPVLANNIEISVDNTNVTITTGSNRTNFNLCYVVLEYIKQT